jgi:uncharacterized membrane protein SirB2
MINSGFVIAAWLLANVIAVGVYDVVAFFFLDYTDTVSYWLQSWFMSFPVLALAIGIVIGHLAWPLHRGNGGPK